MRWICLTSIVCGIFLSCSKDKQDPNPPPSGQSFRFESLRVNGSFDGFEYKGVNLQPKILVSFNAPVNKSSASSGILFRDALFNSVNYQLSYLNGDSSIVIEPANPLNYLENYQLQVTKSLQSTSGSNLQAAVTVSLFTQIDSSDKFPRISDDSLLTLIQHQTFHYFWEAAHPVSGMIRERNSSGDIVTTGGTGMGIMVILNGIYRQFISHGEGLNRISGIIDFLQNKATRYHGAFAHWMNGTDGTTIPFSPNDNGADLVETAYLVQGLLCAREFFDGNGSDEKNLREQIDSIWYQVEWDWFRKNGENVLYWHWSPDKGWIMNFRIHGWNEALITYILAASSPSHTVPPEVYSEGWAGNGTIQNGQQYLGYALPLGPAFGGPLFFEHYSFLGIDPRGLSDTYADYELQVKNHSLINQAYCRSNPKGYYGYSSACWGLTASDLPNGGYDASSPTNDLGVIAPTAAVSSLPFVTDSTLKAIRFFYYTMGDKLWKDYGFVDAFSLDPPWFASSYLAIDQGPQVIMIENYRTGLFWNLFMKCPEIKTGMKKLGFQSPYF